MTFAVTFMDGSARQQIQAESEAEAARLFATNNHLGKGEKVRVEGSDGIRIFQVILQKEQGRFRRKVEQVTESYGATESRSTDTGDAADSSIHEAQEKNQSDSTDRELDIHRRLREMKQNIKALHDRIARIEQVLDLDTEAPSTADTSRTEPLKEEQGKSDVQPYHPVPASTSTTPDADASSTVKWSFLEQTGWLNKLGIVLLIVGLILLFDYSIEQGWITPGVRLAAGLIVSLGVFLWGLLTETERSNFRQVALGGGLAGLYVTGFAAYYIYQYVPYTVSWMYMLIVTGGALYLSLREDEQILSVLGILGGLATPFMLYREGSQFIQLILYTCLLLGVSSTIYFLRRWIALFWFTFVAGLAVLVVTLLQGIQTPDEVPLTRKMVMQGGLLFYLGLYWPVPLYRHMLSVKKPEIWGSVVSDIRNVYLPIIIFGLPIGLFILSDGIWSFPNTTGGLIGLILSATVGSIYLVIPEELGFNIKHTHLYSAFLLSGFSLWLLFAGDYFFAWGAGQMLLMHIIAHLSGDKRLRNATHIIALLIGLRYISSITIPNELSLMGANLAELTTIGSFAASAYILKSKTRWYHLFGLAAFLGWIANFFWTVSHGQVYITVIWGVIALLLLGLGYLRPLHIAKQTGSSVLILTLGKLVFFDLSHLSTIWRILLFLGFGLVLLATAYMLRDHKEGKSTQ